MARLQHLLKCLCCFKNKESEQKKSTDEKIEARHQQFIHEKDSPPQIADENNEPPQFEASGKEPIKTSPEVAAIRKLGRKLAGADRNASLSGETLRGTKWTYVATYERDPEDIDTYVKFTLGEFEVYEKGEETTHRDPAELPGLDPCRCCRAL